MAVFVVRAPAIGDQLFDELRILLSRAYTDERHLATYPPEELARLNEAILAVHNAGAAMPREWLRQFPTVRNLGRRTAERIDSTHFVARNGQTVAGHVALFEQEMIFNDAEHVIAGYIEDVATDPGHLHGGIATDLTKMATDHARANGYHILALGSAIPAFYERLGWQQWTGTASHERRDGSEGIDTQEMVLGLTEDGRALLARHAGGHIFRPTREGGA